MLFFGLFLFSLVLGVAGALLQNSSNKQKANTAQALDQDSIPKATVGDPIGVVFGRVVIDGANTITSGNFESEEVVITSGGGKKK